LSFKKTVIRFVEVVTSVLPDGHAILKPWVYCLQKSHYAIPPNILPTKLQPTELSKGAKKGQVIKMIMILIW
jgi:hypothetical protein